MTRQIAIATFLLATVGVISTSHAQGAGKPDSKSKLESKTARCTRCLDLARKLRAKGKYDAASAAYRESIKNALTKDLKHGIARELGQVLEVQKKWTKALKIYGQQRMFKEELLLLKTLKKFRRGVEVAKLYSDFSGEGDMLFGLRKYRDALKAYQKSDNRLGEALALLALNYRKRGLETLVKAKLYFPAAIEVHRSKGLEQAKPYYLSANTDREKQLILVINRIRSLQAEMNPTKRLKKKMPPLTDSGTRIMRMKVARAYKRGAKLYEELATIQTQLGNSTKAKAFYKQAINFLGSYKKYFTDEGTDKFGVDRLELDNYSDRIGRLTEAMNS